MRGPRGPFGPVGPPTLTPPRPGNFPPPRSPYRSRPPFQHSMSMAAGPTTSSPPNFQPNFGDPGPDSFRFPMRKSSLDQLSSSAPLDEEFGLMLSPSPPTTPPTSDLFPKVQIQPPLKNKQHQQQAQQQQQQHQQQQSQQQQQRLENELRLYKAESHFGVGQALVTIFW